MSTAAGMVALVVDDELPALSELGYLLGRDERVEEVLTASSGTDALQLLDARDVDVVFSDNYFDVPAGRSVVITCPMPTGWTAAQALQALQLRSVIDTYAR